MAFAEEEKKTPILNGEQTVYVYEVMLSFYILQLVTEDIFSAQTR